MKNNIKIFKPNEDSSLNNLFIEEGISAGFPSPAGDFEESRISPVSYTHLTLPTILRV